MFLENTLEYACPPHSSYYGTMLENINNPINNLENFNFSVFEASDRYSQCLKRKSTVKTQSSTNSSD